MNDALLKTLPDALPVVSPKLETASSRWRAGATLRTDIDGLYLTGSTSQPGGPALRRPGRNAARVVLNDLNAPEKKMSLP